MTQSKFPQPSVSRSKRMHPKRAAIAVAACCLLSVGAIYPVPNQDALADNQVALSRWVDVQRSISKEKQDWKIGRELLQNQIEVRQRELEALRAKIAQSQASLGEADKKRAELLSEQEALQATTAALGKNLTALESKTRALLGKLPASLQERAKPLSQGIPVESGASGAPVEGGLGVRFQNVVGVLNFLDKVQREVTVTSELRELAGKGAAEVTVMYLGLGQAFYEGMQGTIGGIGHAGPAGWTWTSKDQHAKAIADAIAIHKGEQVARFLSLPIALD